MDDIEAFGGVLVEVDDTFCMGFEGGAFTIGVVIVPGHALEF